MSSRGIGDMNMLQSASRLQLNCLPTSFVIRDM